MVALAALRSVARSRVAPMLQQTQRRNFALGGHHGPPPEWEGVDKVVRGYFPHDYQLAIAILGGYTGLVVLYKIKSAVSGGSKKEAPAPPAKTPSAPATGSIPGIESPEFEKFIETEAFLKLLEDEDKLKGAIESA